jgi:ligand-binding sensor domain-containing protein/GGDEF domain-containing protein
LLATALAGLLSSPASNAQLPISPQLVLTPADGLPAGYMEELHEDAAGFLWVASWQGVARYDGVRLTQLFEDCCPKSLAVTDDLLWIVTTTENRLEHSLIAMSSSGQASRVPFAAPIHKLLSYGSSLFVLSGAGLHETRSPTDGLSEITSEPLVDGAVINDGLLLVGPSAVIRHRPAAIAPTTTLALAEADRPFRALAGLPDGTFWVATDSSLLHYGPFGRALRETPLPDDATGQPVRITDLSEGHFGELWLSSWEGVFAFNTSSLLYRRVSHAPTQALLRGRSGTLWMGEESALKKVTPTQLLFRRSPGGPHENLEIVTLLERGDSLLVGSRVGLFAASAESLRLEPNTPDVPKVIALESAPSGEIFMGTYSEGVHVWDPEADSLRQLRLRTSPEQDDGVVDIQVDRVGGAWFATYASGLWHAEPPYEAPRRVIDGGSSDEEEPTWPPIYALAISSDGEHVWLAERGKGLSRYDRETSTSTLIGGVELANVMDLHFDRRGHLLAGTRSGELFEIPNPAGAQPRTVRLEVPRFGGRLASIRMIREDAQGFIWLISDAGLTRLDLTGTTTPVSFVEAHQLPLRGMHRQAAVITSSNHLVIGTTEGLASLDIDALATLSTAPPLTITSSLPNITNNQITLPYSARSLTLEAALLDLTDPARNLYSFRLEGAESEWSRPSTNPRVTYASLEPGRYTLQVRAADSLGVWTPEPLSVPVIARQHPALTAPAMALWAALAAILLAVLGRQYLSYRQRLAVRQLADQKTILAQELMLGERSRALEQSRGVLLEVGHLHDGLTGLPNRLAWRTAVLPSILDASLQPHGLALVEVEGLRELNIRHSPATSDKVLKHVAGRLHREPRLSEQPAREDATARVPSSDSVSKDPVLRWGGDQFLLVLSVNRFEALQGQAREILHDAQERPESLPPYTLSAAFTLYPADLVDGASPLHMVHLLELALAWGRARATGFALGLRPRPALTATPLQEVLERATEDFAALHSSGLVTFETTTSALLPAPLPFRGRS